MEAIPRLRVAVLGVRPRVCVPVHGCRPLHGLLDSRYRAHTASQPPGKHSAETDTPRASAARDRSYTEERRTVARRRAADKLRYST